MATASEIVRVAHRFNASPEEVFDAWLDEGTAGKWLFATANEQMVEVEIDAHVGGRFVLIDRRDGRMWRIGVSILCWTGRASWYSPSRCRSSPLRRPTSSSTSIPRRRDASST